MYKQQLNRAALDHIFFEKENLDQKARPKQDLRGFGRRDQL